LTYGAQALTFSFTTKEGRNTFQEKNSHAFFTKGEEGWEEGQKDVEAGKINKRRTGVCGKGGVVG